MDRHIDFGNIKVIPGQNGGRFPFCNTILIDDSIPAVIDPGAGLQQLQAVNQQKDIEIVINSHVHFDHICYNYVFDHSKIMVNEREAIYFQDRRKFIADSGVYEALGEEWANLWLQRIQEPDGPQTSYTPAYRHEWHLSLARLDETYCWGDVIDFGHSKMEIIPAPGHSPGFSVMYFPQEGIVYCSDIDLTKFGPWCQNSAQYIESARRVARLDADTFITGHESGIVSKDEFISRLDQYLDVIFIRDKMLLANLGSAVTFEELVRKGTFYGPKIFKDEFVYCWEWSMTKEHLQRLISQGLAAVENGKYICS
ncbi:MAG: MBL fold metallo-hydrolase [Syntrophomonadaceae bacterium]|nr:MBL fold metallo-hydrolase [Syntrophomonadaceae bacterium]